MPGALTHSPADIVRNLLINLGLGTTPSDSGSWPIYSDLEPGSPDSVITVYNSAAILHGRRMPDGETDEHHGVQIRVRDANPKSGYTKSRAIVRSLDVDVSLNTVTFDSSTYTIQSISRVSDVLSIGKESPTSRRNLFTINAMCSLRET